MDMSQLEVRFTLKGEVSETSFQLYQEDDCFFLKGFSESSGECRVALKRDEVNHLFSFQDKNIVSETKDEIYERLLELSKEWLESQSEGIEQDDDYEADSSSSRPGYGADEIFVENKPFSINSIIELINSGDLEVTPNFQRRFVWDKTRQSRLIESILLGLPLPSIYLNQYKDGRLSVVDGLQRICTIRDFCEDRLVLCNMEYFAQCNGKTFSGLKDVLPMLQVRRFKQTQIMCFVIDYRSPGKLKYDLFRRLNVGGKPLNDQEVRNCLSRPAVQRLLWEMSTLPEFVKATGDSVRDIRMAAQESVLRFMYFYERYSPEDFIGGYDGNLKGKLDSYVEQLNSKNESELNAYKEPFKQSLRFAYELLGDYAFRKVEMPSGKRGPVNKSLFVATTVILSRHYADYSAGIEPNRDLKEKSVQLLTNNAELQKAVTSSTAVKSNIKLTFQCLKEELFDRYLLR